jgi:hypothetical protein
MLATVRRDSWLAVLAAVIVIGFWGLLAYILLPVTWRHYEHQEALAGLPMSDTTAR